jgi:hypothetical protein
MTVVLMLTMVVQPATAASSDLPIPEITVKYGESYHLENQWSKANPTLGDILQGTWTGYGYYCERKGNKLTERVSLSVRGNYLTATKITGDHCVPAGNITLWTLECPLPGCHI